ncbi:hypothetical protein RYZ26_11715 [Terasakiella sp. A23]|uniref:hypothetical protein n=1 Tax=Terasakiella sp. FCG-A23 TaxID=3080561 RepID=UPI002955D81D|nr:hypothetical protein [Terasakiella sp. A23]MDV7340266.1 hypothetical protein [Terasakiella sp. A23]
MTVKMMKPRDMKKTVRTIGIGSAFLAMLSLSACTSNFLVGDAISAVATDKTISDHLVSYVSRKDCSTVRTELGLSYCKEDDPRMQKQAKTHCYRELGKVTCYEEADLTSVRQGIEDRKEAPRQWQRKY